MKLLYFSPVNWNHIKQRPHFLAEYFADNSVEVTYFSRTPYLKPGCGKQEKINDHLSVCDIPVFPFALKLGCVEKFNNRRLKNLVGQGGYDVIVLGDPRLVDAVPAESRALLVYDCMDKNPDFHAGKVRQMIAGKESELCRRAEKIVCSSNKLKEYLLENYSVEPEKVCVVRNAAADDFLSESEEKHSVPATDLLYVGTVDDWFDWQSVTEFAEKFPQKHIRIVGPVMSDLPSELPGNIELYGKVPHPEVARHIKSASLLVMPFKINPLIEAVDPVKLYEYLALGKRVLAPWWSELEYFKTNPHLSFYNGSKDFSEKASKLLEEPENHCENPDYDFLSRNNWSTRGREFLSFIRR
ncbi:MAG: glycosyltransferase [Lentisphaeria bacterium]|nr:glycosyltransferase [Lentisphaeria bacterium]